MIDEQRIIAEITNDYDVMIELALKGFILMWQKTPCLYRREMNATSAEFTKVIEVDNRT